MKKTLPILFLLLSVSIYAQLPPLLPPPLFACESDNDGFVEFDLTSRIPNILEGMDPGTTIVTFHETMLDSYSNINPILNPDNYLNIIPFDQTVYTRKTDTTNGNVYYQDLVLKVNQIPTANAASLYYCDPMELPIYNLTDANAQITGGVSNVTVSYFETLADAQNGANPIIDGYIPLTSPGTQILYARVAGFGCTAISTLTLNTQNCDSGSAPFNLTAANVTDTSFQLNWSYYAPGSPNGYDISIVPAGLPPSNPNFVAVSGFSYVITGLNPDACYSVYVRSYFSQFETSQWSAQFNICMPNCANNGACNEALLFKAFLDTNNNGLKDPNEVDFNSGNFVYQVNDSETNQYGTPYNNGLFYIFDSNPSNSYDISFAVNESFSSYYTSSQIYSNITLPSESGINTLLFPIVNTIPYGDAQVSLFPVGQPRPGFSYGKMIAYRNYGLQNIESGTITFTKSPNVTVSSISQTGTTATNDGFSYNFSNLAPFEVRYFVVDLLVPTIPTVNLGDLLTNSVSIQINDDVNVANNTSSVGQIVVGSFDPNDKMEAHGGKIVHSSFTVNDFLYYTIQFENTGTANAEFVRIEDLLDNQLDENTFEMISSSHNVNTKRMENQLTWHFFNIDLPPTSINSGGSHGYVSFRIKPKSGYALGDTIPNSASIYFDYNPPIVTNTFNTEFVQALKTNKFTQDNIVLFPNPAKNIVQITLQNSNEQIQSLVVYDLLGKEVKTTAKLNRQIGNINISNLSKGIYLVEIITENKFKLVKKLVIE